MSTQHESASDISQALANYIAEEILGDESTIDFDGNLFQEEIVNSLGMLRLVGFIELSYSIAIPPEEFVIENFRSINAIGNYVRRLRDSAVV